MANDLTPTSQPTGGTDISSSFGASANLETMLRKTMAERLGQSPLMGLRENAAQQLLTSNPRGREFLAQKVQETPLSPTQQSSIMASRRAADTVPLMTLNDLLNVQTGGIENMIKSAVDPYEKAMQYQRDLALKSMDSSSGGIDDLTKLLLGRMKSPTQGQKSNAANAQSALRAITRYKDVLTRLKGANLTKTVAASKLGPLAFIGGEDAQTIRDAGREIMDVLTRFRTGAALNEQEQAFYEQNIPGTFDSPEIMLNKLNNLETLYKQVSQMGNEPNVFKILAGDYSEVPGFEALYGNSGNDWEIVQ